MSAGHSLFFTHLRETDEAHDLEQRASEIGKICSSLLFARPRLIPSMSSAHKGSTKQENT